MLSIVAGLEEEAWHRSIVPSGWTPAGLVEHLGGAEWHWFQAVVAGKTPEPAPWDDDLAPYDPTAAFVCDLSSAEIIGFYRDQCAGSDAVLAVTPLSAPPRGRHGVPGQREPPDVRREPSAVAPLAGSLIACTDRQDEMRVRPGRADGRLSPVAGDSPAFVLVIGARTGGHKQRRPSGP